MEEKEPKSIGDLLDMNDEEFQEYMKSRDVGELRTLKVILYGQLYQVISMKNDLRDQYKDIKEKTSEETEEEKKTLASILNSVRDLYICINKIQDKNTKLKDYLDEMEKKSV